MNLSIYIDAAGAPDDQPFVVAAGYVARDEQWSEFEQPWQAALRANDIIPPFHMVDFEHGRSNNRAVKDKILTALAALIKQYTLAGFSCAVEMAAYRRVNDSHPLEEILGKPYALAARGLLRHLNMWRERHLMRDANVRIFVESGTKHHGDLEQVCRRDGFSMPISVPKDNPSVQPADMLGWEILTGLRTESASENLLNMLGWELSDYKHGVLREEELCESMKAANAPARIELPSAEFRFHSAPRIVRRRTIE